uniref:Cadherin domain-containing protein n=1 Tax=Electrophorus electricus TaxID=8005 RepID=A0AAY5EQR5_ELEEL
MAVAGICNCLGKIVPPSFLAFLLCCGLAFGQIRYSIPEELDNGAIVGDIVQDLGLDIRKLSSRKIKVTADDGKRYVDVNPKNGKLFVNERIDRETLCDVSSCILNLEVLLENPSELHNIEVEIVDANDNAPQFPRDDYQLEITESASPGSRFPIEHAQDPDVGTNTVRFYRLSTNEHFALDSNKPFKNKHVELVLKNNLDREIEGEFSLILTAVDGGNPPRSGTVVIQVLVQDVNDNAPIFSQSLYRTQLFENSAPGTTVIKITATDLDEGANGQITYYINHLSDNTNNLFQIDENNGEISVTGQLDHESASSYEIEIQAEDGGGQTGHCKVLIELADVNDNAPVIMVKSLTNPIPENIAVGSEVAILNVKDQDSGENSRVSCSVPINLPFKLQRSIKNYFTLVTITLLDREQIAEYNITITATDGGTPTLFSTTTLNIHVGDINDNSPVFGQHVYGAYVVENNKPGTSICSVSASDPDWRQNGTVMYSLVSSEVNSVPVSSFISINADTGVIHAVRSFDFEQFRKFKVQVVARDNGSPPLSSNVTVNVFITDENDNSPQILYPAPEGKTLMTEMVPKASLSGSLVSKVIAVDADSGQNAWLSYQIVKSTDPGLFSIGLHNGEIRALRDITESDSIKQNLIISVKDNGQPPLSATCSVYLLISDNLAEVPEFKDMTYEESNSKLTSYLIIALVSVSTFFLTFIILILAVRFCHRRKPRLLFDGAVAIPSAYLPPNYAEVEGAGTLCSSYNYDTYLTTGSRTSDFKFVSSYNDNTLPADGSLKTNRDDSNMTSLSDAGEILEVRFFL